MLRRHTGKLPRRDFLTTELLFIIEGFQINVTAFLNLLALTSPQTGANMQIAC